MTGFGRGHAKLQNGKITAEIKTVNHKFFDLSLKIPESLNIFEDRIKEILQKRLKRGKVNLNLSYDMALAKGETVKINKALAKNYYTEMSQLSKHLGMAENISMKDIITLPGVVNYNIDEKVFAKLWPKTKEAIDNAVDKLIAEREKEGKSIFIDLKSRAAKIDKMVSVIKKRANLTIEEYRKKFSDKIKDLANGRQIDLGRLEMEVAIYAKNSDVSEEITRLKNHLSNFRGTISGHDEVGKKLDFIAQELHREINTVGSKASDFKISKNVIEVKSEVEKIREQVKNLE
jgi:uncharacterized protein (TIGR00255 family)